MRSAHVGRTLLSAAFDLCRDPGQSVFRHSRSSATIQASEVQPFLGISVQVSRSGVPGPSVPEGRPRVARRFSAGWLMRNAGVPEGRLKELQSTGRPEPPLGVSGVLNCQRQRRRTGVSAPQLIPDSGTRATNLCNECSPTTPRSLQLRTSFPHDWPFRSDVRGSRIRNSPAGHSLLSVCLNSRRRQTHRRQQVRERQSRAGEARGARRRTSSTSARTSEPAPSQSLYSRAI